ncbi:hypothetical protein A9563_08940 [Salmonella enterica subsp. enterica serovar Rubislaw]|nr:hypothetical protein [Salmonella enterica subsp. enterica serovar Rubislaw]EEE7824851.1 hypothetical protein [Salmonella enterica]EEG6274298.1 hypothetical protein [Salmonella enterica subsp. enterica]EJB3447814.1 hypothetical protein [Salmonella enterica subsp. enterica]EJB3512789.1 hypothetical protein [Salmonella enterica subsp. enterica]
MFVFFAFFVLFIYKELGGIKVGRDSFLFFDYMFFGSGWKANIPSMSMLIVALMGLAQDYIKNYNFENLLINSLGVLAAVLFFIHGRFLSGVSYSNGKKIIFFRELLWRGGLKPHFVVLWLSRLLYIAFFVLHFYKKGY